MASWTNEGETWMKFLSKIWEALIQWAEEVNEYRRKNNIRNMYY